MEDILTVFFTSQDCAHCNSIKGNVSFPSDRFSFSPEYIKSILRFRGPVRVKYLIEIVSEGLSRSQPIFEVNIYFMVPDFRFLFRILQNSNSISSEWLEDSGIEVLSSLCKISIGKGNRFNFLIEGNENEKLSEFYREKYILSKIPNYITQLKQCFRDGTSVDPIVDTIESKFLKKQILNKTQLQNYRNDPRSFDSHVFNHIVTYDYILSHTVPEYIRVYETHYPAWCIIKISEWENGILNKAPVFARATNYFTERQTDGTYTISTFTSGEKIFDILDGYMCGKIVLEPRDIVERKTYSWQENENNDEEK